MRASTARVFRFDRGHLPPPYPSRKGYGVFARALHHPSCYSSAMVDSRWATRYRPLFPSSSSPRRHFTTLPPQSTHNEKHTFLSHHTASHRPTTPFMMIQRMYSSIPDEDDDDDAMTHSSPNNDGGQVEHFQRDEEGMAEEFMGGLVDYIDEHPEMQSPWGTKDELEMYALEPTVDETKEEVDPHLLGMTRSDKSDEEDGISFTADYVDEEWQGDVEHPDQSLPSGLEGDTPPDHVSTISSQEPLTPEELPSNDEMEAIRMENQKESANESVKNVEKLSQSKKRKVKQGVLSSRVDHDDEMPWFAGEQTHDEVDEIAVEMASRLDAQDVFVTPEGDMMYKDMMIPQQFQHLIFDPDGVHSYRDVKNERKRIRMERRAEANALRRKRNRFPFTGRPYKEDEGGQGYTRRQLRIMRHLTQVMNQVVTEDLDANSDIVRFGFSIDHVEVSRTLRKATVYWSSMENSERVEAVLPSLAVPMRTYLARRAGMKHVPSLAFAKFEQSPESLALDQEMRDVIDAALEDGLDQEAIERALKLAHNEVDEEEAKKEKSKRPWNQLNPLV